jgi:hypothetical protein
VIIEESIKEIVTRQCHGCCFMSVVGYGTEVVATILIVPHGVRLGVILLIKVVEYGKIAGYKHFV